ncbi:hypothetical protein Tco_0196499 [Tanacetum coccineum]
MKMTIYTLGHVEQQKIKRTNEPMIPSTGVKDTSASSRSKPRSNTKKDGTLPAKSDMKKVEAHSRNNKSSVKQKNHVDSSISFKRTIINSNSTSVCQTCNKCLMSFNHDKCVVRSLKFVKKSPVNKVWRVKQVKQVWQATGKLFTNVGFQWQPTGRKSTLGEQCPLTRFTESKVVPATQPESVSTSKIMITERLSNTSQKPLTRNDHFGAIMGYEDYVIGDSVISRVYYVEGLGYNLFSVRQFYDLDLEVAFHKHSCHVRDVNGVDLIKGNVRLWKTCLERVVRFGKKEKLAPRFVGPFKIIEKVGPIAYMLDLPKELDGVHDTFHVSNLKKCLDDPTLQVPLDEI